MAAPEWFLDEVTTPERKLQSRMRMGPAKPRGYNLHYNRQPWMHYRVYDTLTVKANWSMDNEVLMATEADYRVAREYFHVTESKLDIKRAAQHSQDVALAYRMTQRDPYKYPRSWYLEILLGRRDLRR